MFYLVFFINIKTPDLFATHIWHIPEWSQVFRKATNASHRAAAIFQNCQEAQICIEIQMLQE